jgi:hypothetical protein
MMELGCCKVSPLTIKGKPSSLNNRAGLIISRHAIASADVGDAVAGGQLRLLLQGVSTTLVLHFFVLLLLWCRLNAIIEVK